MRLARHNPIRLLLLGYYVLAVTASPWFHSHGHSLAEPRCAASVCEHVGFLAGCDEGPKHPADAPHSPPLSPSHGDQNCPVCEFLIQKPVPLAASDAVQYAAPVQELVLGEPVAAVAPIPPTWHVRAPPVLS